MGKAVNLKIYLNGSKLLGKYLLVFDGEDLVSRTRISRFTNIFIFYWRSSSLEYFALNPSFLTKIKIILKQLFRDYKQNRFGFIWNFFLGYKVIIHMKQTDGYLSFAIEGDDRVAWISRSAINLGVVPYSLSHSIEYDFSRFSRKFCAFIWGIKGFNDEKLIRVSDRHKTRLTATSIKVKKFPKPGILAFEQLENCHIYHGKNVVFEHALYPTDCDNFIDNSWPSDMAVRLSHGLAVITSVNTVKSHPEPSIFFGSSTSWFHFLVEVFPRYLIYGSEKIRTRSIVIEHNVPSQIIEVLSLLSSKAPIKVFPFESAHFSNLVTSMESRFPNGLDLINRAADIHLVRDFFRVNSFNASHKSERRIFILRNRNLFRRSKEIEQIIDFAKKYNFEFIDTGELSFKDQFKLFSAASHVIGETGSSLTNLLFCQNSCKVLELNLNNFMPGFFEEFCKVLNLQHKPIEKVSFNSGEIVFHSNGNVLNFETFLN